jgi:hypothetical protein
MGLQGEISQKTVIFITVLISLLTPSSNIFILIYPVYDRVPLTQPLNLTLLLDVGKQA